jgi:D-arginine dehydrogenase
VLALRHRAAGIARHGDAWHVETSSGAIYQAGIVVNAAGAWGDEVAALANVAPLGLIPKRRTAAIVDPSPWNAEHWPMVLDVSENWYARPEARTRLMVSPADETPTYPHDVQPEEIDIAIGIDRMRQALDIQVRRIEHSWSGLRTFTPDGSLAFGWDRDQDGFFWCVGQGGYGIQTAPAAGRLAAALVLGHNPDDAAAAVAAIDPGRFRGR